MTNADMTREEMLKEIETLRTDGAAIGITGSGIDWQCQFDAVTGKGADPMKAFENAKQKIREKENASQSR